MLVRDDLLNVLQENLISKQLLLVYKANSHFGKRKARKGKEFFYPMYNLPHAILKTENLAI